MFKQLQILIRPVEAHEAPLVVDTVFEALSIESRRLRFHVPMPRLPSSFRHQLASLDGRRNVAFGAWVDGEVVGIGRLAQVSECEVEVAVAVGDDWHNRGIGRRLLTTVADEARRLGYRRLSADVLAENGSMLHLLRQVFPDALTRRSSGVVHVTCPLDADEARALAGPDVPAQRSRRRTIAAPCITSATRAIVPA